MAKLLYCRDVGLDCDFVVRAATEAELLKKLAGHAARVHRLETESPAVLERVRAAIRDEARLGEE